jgi:hypothetical protein
VHVGFSQEACGKKPLGVSACDSERAAFAEEVQCVAVRCIVRKHVEHHEMLERALPHAFGVYYCKLALMNSCLRCSFATSTNLVSICYAGSSAASLSFV